MRSRVSLLLGVTAGAWLVHERRVRKTAERVAAAALETLLNAIEANDRETGMHVRRVASYAVILADAAGLGDRARHAVERVALFHDIGKIHEALFDIVHDGARLSPSERRAIATHPRVGYEVLAPLSPIYPDLPEAVLSHHERWDGHGYPRRLHGEQIPLTARIVTIADTFDAVAHNRRYRRGGGVEAATRVIEAGRASQFDPSLVDLLMLPPVLDEFERAHIAARRRSRASRERRDARQPASVPDINFRWRSESLAETAVPSTT